MNFFLSIGSKHVARILAGEKKWEFRANPSFGNLEHVDLAADDTLLIVSVGAEKREVVCAATVGRILRGDAVRTCFGDRKDERWLEAGCAPGTDRDWGFFEREILNIYPVAVELAVLRTFVPIPVADIVNRRSGKPWKGIGLTPVGDLHRYEIGGRPVEQQVAKIIGKSDGIGEKKP